MRGLRAALSASNISSTSSYSSLYCTQSPDSPLATVDHPCWTCNSDEARVFVARPLLGGMDLYVQKLSTSLPFVFMIRPRCISGS